MKKIGIILAEPEEFEVVKENMEKATEKVIQHVSFWLGNLENKSCVIVKAGVGKVNAARITQMMIDYFELEYLLNLGAAGALDPKLEIGDIVIGKKLVQHDFDITAFGHSKGYITGVGDAVKSDETLIQGIKQALDHLDERDYRIMIGTIATGDIFCTEISMKDKIYAKFDANCVDMEAAAIGQVCHLAQIPFLAIRSISDTPNGDNAMTYEQFVKLASKRCVSILKEFFRENP